MVDVLLVRPSYIFKGKENKLFEEYINLARMYLKDKLGFEGTEGLHVPAGIAYIASQLEKDGFRVNVLDLHLLRYLYGKIKTIEDGVEILRHTLENSKPDIVGIECMYSRAIEESIKLSEKTKEILDVPVILGGSHATFMDYFLLENDSVDFIVRGEGEITFSKLTKAILNNENLLVQGVSYKRGNKIVRTGISERIKNLNFLPYPARHLFPIRDLYKINNHTDLIISSRGCKYDCSFCVNRYFWGKSVQFREVENVIGEIDEMVKKYNTRHLCFYDETFGLQPIELLSDLCEKITEYPKLDWAIETRLDLINKEMLKMLAESNCRLIYFGFETFSSSALACSNKNLINKQIYQNLLLTKEAGIESVMGTFIVGLPGETKESFKETLEKTEKMVRKGIIDICYFLPLMPFPGTDIFHQPKKYNIKIHSCDFNKYYYILNNPITLETRELSSHDIKDMHEHALKRMINALKMRMKNEGFFI